MAPPAPALTGRSPRGRGRPKNAIRPDVVHGSIPAWAGETPRDHGPGSRPGVDPRVGGGDHVTITFAPYATGRSPRGRGRRSKLVNGAALDRSIPAWAGETAPQTTQVPVRGVDPRVGGGDPWTRSSPWPDRGRSPRGRGRPRRRPHSGSRPAVDPRVGGGDGDLGFTVEGENGRSPRGRGRRAPSPGARVPARSIPAWAGETSTGTADHSQRRVDPRVGGGDRCAGRKAGRIGGRSPRGRGRRGDGGPLAGEVRSIPAWAGETIIRRKVSTDGAVDPRVGGGDMPAGSRAA